ncbi:SPW repeat protein [Microvirga sp. M2]|uniref:SPW repeat protein n=1 Tax=Microvirga sp. M2 TaxID=3073270 RepID=UPI0039C42CB3
MLKNTSQLTVMNIVNGLLAILLFISPWILGFREVQAASWNAWVCGVLIAALAVAALGALQEWEEWGSAVVGLWTLIAPWALGFTDVRNAMWVHIGVGIVVAIISIVEAWLLHGNLPTRAA